jgi:hypothetical protein
MPSHSPRNRSPRTHHNPPLTSPAMRFFALRTTTNSFKTHRAWVPGSGLVQIAVSSMLRLDCSPPTQLFLRSTVDTALQIYRQLSSSPYRIDHFSCANCRTKEAVTPKSVSCRSQTEVVGLQMAGDLPVEANCTGYAECTIKKLILL